MMAARSLLFVLALVGGCASSGLAPPRPLRDVAVFRTSSARRVELDALLDAIDAADVVVFAEQHGHPTGLSLFSALFERSLTRQPNAALCLEFLTRETQHLVDAYCAGLLDWEDFEEACEGVAGSRPGPHRPLIDAARAAGVPVVAANAPRLYTSAAREHGFERLTELTAEQRRLFELPGALPDEAYRARFDEVMRDHVEDEELDGYFRAQSVWDATMAASVASSVSGGRGPVFLVVGSFHANRNGGTLMRIRRRRAGVRTVVISTLAEDAGVPTDEHLALADFIAYVGPSVSQ